MVEAATVDELRADLDKYLQMVDDGNEVILFKDGHKLGSIVPRTSGASIVESLTGFLKDGIDIDLETAKDEYFREKYGLAD